MSTVCTHPTGTHRSGETCRLAREVKPRDQIRILSGSALAPVHDAYPSAEDGHTAILLDVAWDGPCPTLIASDMILEVRPADGLKAEELPEPEPEAEVEVYVEVAEKVIYDTHVTITVPASAGADDAALLTYLDANWDQYADLMDNAPSTVTEQSVIHARIATRGPAV